MSQNIYLATTEPQGGKTVVLLGLLEMLSRKVGQIGIFRPVIQSRDQMDEYIDLAVQRYKLKFKYEEMYAYTNEEASTLLTQGQNDTLMKTILDKYKNLERQCDFVVCVGTDFTHVTTPFEFDFNANLANHLGCPVMAIVSGKGKSVDETVAAVRIAREGFQEYGCSVLACIVNRVPENQVELTSKQLEALKDSKGLPYIIKEEQSFNFPTVADITKKLQANYVIGEEYSHKQEVQEKKVAAMQLRHLLPHLKDGTLIIVPGDRADVIMGGLVTLFSENAPRIAGMMLTGGLIPEEPVQNLIKGLKVPCFPIACVETDTYVTSMQIGAIQSGITPDNERKIASALGLFSSCIDTKELEEKISVSHSQIVTPLMFEYQLIDRAAANKKHIVLPEGAEERILRAAEILQKRRVVELTLLGDDNEIKKNIAKFGLDLPHINIINPRSSQHLEEFAAAYTEFRKHKGMTLDVARDQMMDESYFGSMMVKQGLVDGMVSGAVHTTQHTLRPSFEFIRTKPGCKIISSVFFMCLEDRVLVYGDCAVNPNPNPEELADIAIASAETASLFGVDARVAMLSYSTGSSGKGEDVERVREAARLVKEQRPELKIEGPIQYDAAIDLSVAHTKLPDSEVAGRATVFIFPDLNTGNNTYKAVQRSANAVAIGPVLQGLNKPVNDLSRGCTVTDIVNTVAITAIQAQMED